MAARVLAPRPVPPLGGHELLIFLLQVGMLLLAATLLGRLATRLTMPAIVGELLAGVVLGPSLLSHLSPALWNWLLPAQREQFHLLDAAGQVGVILFVGVTGTDLDFRLVRRRGLTAARVSLPGLLLPLVLGVAAGYLVPAALLGGSDRAVFALFLGVAMSVSAIPVIAKTLADMRLLHRDIGQLTLAASTVDDTLGWLLLSVVAGMAGSGVHAGSVARTAGFLAAFLAGAVWLGRPLVSAALRTAGRADGDGPLIACTVLIIVLGAAITQAIGLEAVFGALVAGIIAGTCGRVDPARLAPLRVVVTSVLAPLFFATAGLRIDLATLREPATAMAALLVLATAIAGKFAGAYIGAKSSRLTGWEAVALGAGMNARGVVQLVVATVGLSLGVLTTATYTIVVLVALTTSVMAPPILRVAMARVEQTAEERLRGTAYAVRLPGAGTGWTSEETEPAA
jgi:Kef-type K+ transport system membrane component KefB